MYLKDNQIVEILVDYIDDERQKQPVLINGEWGSGKTHFIKKALIDLEEKNKNDGKNGRNIFMISLYGIDSCEKIKNEIHLNIMGTYLDRQGCNKMTSKIKIVSKCIKAILNCTNIKIENLAELRDVLKVDKSVIILDDLERSSIDINELMGFINDLAENKGAKVIVVANEQKLDNYLSKDLTTKDLKTRYSRYKEAKEKLIGLTIYYSSTMCDIYDNIVNEHIIKENAKKYLISNKEEVINIFSTREHYNIRTLIFALITFEKIYNIISGKEFDEYDLSEQEVTSILIYTIETAVRFKKGDIKDYWKKVKSNVDVVYTDDDSIKGYRFIYRYIETRYIDIEEIKGVLLEKSEKEKIEMNNDKPSLEKLLGWKYLEDSEISSLLVQMETKLNNYNFNELRNIIVVLLQLKKVKFKNVDDEMIERVVRFTIEKIESKEENINKSQIDIISDDEDFKTDYYKVVNPIIDAISSDIIKEATEMNKAFNTEEEEWGSKFKITCEGNKATYKEMGRFLYYLDIDKVYEKLEKSLVKDICFFINGINFVYDMSNICDFYLDDKEKLNQLIERIDVEKLSENKVTKKNTN